MQPMQYDDLLKASYDVGHSLIYSVNKSLVHTEPKKRWKNFITAIPSFDGNRYRKTGESMEREYRLLHLVFQ